MNTYQLLRTTQYGLPIVLTALVFSVLLFAHTARGEEGVRTIVVFKEGAQKSEARASTLRAHGVHEFRDLAFVRGAVARLTEDVRKDLARDPSVLRVDEDVRVFALASASARQTLPWGIDRIDAEQVWGSTTGSGVKVAVIDTGVSLGHPDLKNNLIAGYNAISPWLLPNDDNGHGSHVAGTIAALNNTVGVVGVGPSAKIMPVKVLDRRGSGYLSDIIEGMEWSVSHGAQVINMSLGTPSDVQSFHDAVAHAYALGVTVVAAAGNSGGSVLYPAAYDEVIAVSATDESNALAYFSSRGAAVDIAAPGVNIYSTYKGTGYTKLSGTSMAAPHVTGTVALVLATPATGQGNGDALWSPGEVKSRLTSTATDLGASGVDNLYGAGLVNARAATGL